MNSELKYYSFLRVSVLEMENRQLQDKTMKLSNQVSSLERALKNAESFYSLEVKTFLFFQLLLSFCYGIHS